MLLFSFPSHLFFPPSNQTEQMHYARTKKIFPKTNKKKKMYPIQDETLAQTSTSINADDTHRALKFPKRINGFWVYVELPISILIDKTHGTGMIREAGLGGRWLVCHLDHHKLLLPKKKWVFFGTRVWGFCSGMAVAMVAMALVHTEGHLGFTGRRRNAYSGNEWRQNQCPAYIIYGLSIKNNKVKNIKTLERIFFFFFSEKSFSLLSFISLVDIIAWMHHKIWQFVALTLYLDRWNRR